MPSEQFANSGQTTLVSGISSSAFSITVNSVLGFPTAPQFRILIDQEVMLVFAISGAVWSVQRAVEPVAGIQAAAAHSAGALVSHVLTAQSIKSAGIQNNLTATSVPTSSADVNHGYVPGSMWYDSTINVLYICTDNAVGAATWLPIPLLTNFSIIIDSNGKIGLVNDANVSGSASKYYGTNAGGVRGFYTLPSGMAIGANVSGSGASQLLYVDAGNNLAELGTVSGVGVQFGTTPAALGFTTVIDAGNNAALSAQDAAGFCLAIIAINGGGGPAAKFTDTNGDQVLICGSGYAFQVVSGNIGFWGANAGQQTSHGAIGASGTYGTTEQNMLNDCYAALRAYGLLA